MDFETVEFYERVRDAYLGIAEREPKRFQIVDASGPVEEIHHRVVEIVTPLIELQ
jgi:dTMP kinase